MSIIACSVDGCEKPHLARKMCSMHYARMRRTGTTADPIVEAPNACLIDGCCADVHGHGYCVKHYKRLKRHGDPLYSPVANCDTCGEAFKLGTRGVPSLTCPACREVRRRDYLYASAKERTAERFMKSRKFGVCQRCGEPFERNFRDTRSVMCVPCKRIERTEKARAWDKANPRRLTDERRMQLKAAKHRRRVVQRNARADKFTAEEIFERDEWSCQICGLDIDPKDKFPSRDSASLDHIIPISKGGTHTLDNVQLACMGCNWDKGDRVVA